MKVNDVNKGIHKHTKRLRVGRGPGSGRGRTAGRAMYPVMGSGSGRLSCGLERLSPATTTALLFITDPGGNPHSAEVASDAKITVDGKDTKLADLKEGLTVKLTIEKGDSGIQIKKVEGTTK